MVREEKETKIARLKTRVFFHETTSFPSKEKKPCKWFKQNHTSAIHLDVPLLKQVCFVYINILNQQQMEGREQNEN